MTDHRAAEIRADMRRRRAGLTREERERAAYAVARRLLASHIYRRARRIAVYLSFRNELDLAPLIERAWAQGKETFVPIIDEGTRPGMRFSRLLPETALTKNRFGIAEPRREERIYLESRWLDLVLVPMLAFDRHGNRLGMGAGYYDRCFSFLLQRTRWQKPRLCGVAYAFQEVGQLDPAPWDVPLSCVATEQALRMTKRNSRNA